MISRFWGFVICIVVLQNMTAAQQDWQLVAPYPPRFETYSTSVSGNIAYFWCAKNIVFSTDDAGDSFTIFPSYAPTNNIALGCCSSQGIAFADSLTGYITDIAHGEFRTTDGGYHWTRMTQENWGTSINLVGFGTSKVGWKFGDGGSYKTTDAGTTWNFFTAPFRNGGIFTKMFALDDKNLWLLKSYYNGRLPEGSIWYSSDGGTKWARLNTGIISDSSNQVTYLGFHMNSSGVGYAAGSIFRPGSTPALNRTFGLVQRTSDFGKTWRSWEVLNDQYTNLEVISDSICIAFGNAGVYPDTRVCYLRTTNMGDSWQYTGHDFENNYYNNYYTSAYIPSKNTLIVSTVQGLYRSNDKGATYSRITASRDMDVQDIAFDNRPVSPETQLGVVVSNFNKFMISRDGGQTWTLKNFPDGFNVDFTSMRISANIIYLTVGQRVLYKSADFGENWHIIPTNTDGGLRALDVYGPDTIAIRAFPDILTSTDGGKNWKHGPLAGNIWINEINMINSSCLFASGTYYDTSLTCGILYMTTDGGSNWRIQDFPSEMKHIEFIDNTTGFAIGGNTLYVTRNGGNKWNTLKTGATSFTFFDKYHGIICMNDSALITSDQGRTWQRSTMIFKDFPSKLLFNAHGDLFAISNGRLDMLQKASSLFTNQSIMTDNLQGNFIIYHNYPNPFNPSTTISYGIPEQMHVELKVFDMLGREISTLVNAEQRAGKYNIQFDGSSLPSGVYVYTLHAGQFRGSKKILLVK